MAKKDPKVKILHLFIEDGAYGVEEIEIHKSLLDQGKVLSRTNPDIFAICLSQVTKKCREIFGF